MIPIKQIFDFKIPYWKNKWLQFTYNRIDYKTEIVYRFTIWKLHLIDERYEGEDSIGTKWWKHFDVWSYKTEFGNGIDKESGDDNIGEWL